MWGPENARGEKAHARTSRQLVTVAFRAALGEVLFVHSTLRAAVFVHPTDATGTKVGFEGELTSIEASFDFHPLKPAS